MIEHGPIGPRDVLLVVDVQNDFCSGGKLAVPGGEEVVPALNRLATQFEHVVCPATASTRPSPKVMTVGYQRSDDICASADQVCVTGLNA